MANMNDIRATIKRNRKETHRTYVRDMHFGAYRAVCKDCTWQGPIVQGPYDDNAEQAHRFAKGHGRVA